MSCGCPLEIKSPSLILLASLLVTKTILMLSLPYCLLWSFVLYVIFGGWRFLRVLLLTLPRDIRALGFLVKIKLISRRVNNASLSIYDLYKETIERKGASTIGLMFEEQKWSFGDLLELTDRIASVYQKLGIKKGDKIGFFMESHAVYPPVWLGAAKFGAATGLLNFSLKEKPLQHSIDELKPKLLVTSVTLADNLINITMPSNCIILTIDDRAITPENFRCSERPIKSPEKLKTPVQCLDKLIAESDMSFVRDASFVPSIKDTILFIYTSGTTGLPKAAVITLARYLLLSVGPNHFLRLDADKDVIYNSLPLYHTAGGITGIGQHLIFGMPVAIRRKFSASQFWTDCIKYNATIIQYVGELCRYLLAQPEKPQDRAHKVRLAYGNGLRPQVWAEFVKRFQVAQIGEFYGATESNANFCNSENKFGAIGFSSAIVPWAYPVYLIRTDPVTEEVLRDPRTGLCIPCNYGEVGQLVGAIKPNDPCRKFDGYTNSKASSKKIINDVFKTGDQWFLSGDLLMQDDLGFFYFRDRLGDTFRWRGENVSTSEVESVLMSELDLHCCVVYGVEVPNCEGKAGMIALGMNHGDLVNETGKSLKLTQDECLEICVRLRSCAEDQLPAYAQPLFVRFVDQIDTTGTFKLRKVDLVKNGFDPSINANDLVFYLNSKSRAYEKLTPEIFQQIHSGHIRF